MLLLRKIIVSFTLLTVSACGFQPIYAKYDGGGVQEYLSSVQVSVAKSTKLSEILKAKIEDNFHHNDVAKEYHLETSLDYSEISVLTDSDGTVSRYRLNMSSPYKLIRIKDGKQLSQGVIHHSSSYNLSQDADYATFIAKQDALKRITKELAEDYKMRISSFFMSNKR